MITQRKPRPSKLKSLKETDDRRRDQSRLSHRRRRRGMRKFTATRRRAPDIQQKPSTKQNNVNNQYQYQLATQLTNSALFSAFLSAGSTRDITYVQYNTNLMVY